MAACVVSSPCLDQKGTKRSFFVINPDIIPVIQGPKEQPISPHMARIPNIRVPPFGKVSEDREKVPGHIIETVIPVRLQDIRENSGLGLRDVIR